MSNSNLVRLGYKREVSYGVTPPAIAASKVVQDITYTAALKGEKGNSIQIDYTAGGTAGSEIVTVTGNLISVQIESGVSTATQVLAAINGSAAALALISAAITGVGATAQVSAAAANLTGGLKEFQIARFTQEKYTGTPETKESAQIRIDRMSSGQVVTGLKVDGGHSFELAKEQSIEDFMSSAMFNPWVLTPSVTANMSFVAATGVLTRGSGSFINESVKVGRFVKLTNFVSPVNNVICMVTAVTDLTLTLAMPEGMVDAASHSATYQVCDYLEIGVTKQSLTIEKTFLDLATKAIIYRGALVSKMSLKVDYGNLISGDFETSGNDWETAAAANQFASYQEYFADQATSDTMNGSVDMPFIATNVTGAWATDAFCIQSLQLTLNNNLAARTCIGRIAPEDYNPGTAQIQVDLSSYLKDANWTILAAKLAQTPFALGFQVQNGDGWYGFYMPAIQVSFDDPESGGKNQEISMNMKGFAKVGASGESAIAIYRDPT